MVWIAIFFANAAVLVLEIVGARALAPFFGDTAESWAGILGVVLLGLAIGYWGGGIVADRIKDHARHLTLLTAVLAAAGLSTMTSWLSIGAIAGLGSYLVPLLGLTGAAAVAALFILFLPSVFLAAVSPISVKILLATLEKSATVVGRVSALGAAGSVIGSLGVGAFVIPYVGSHTTLLAIGVLLLILSLVVALVGRGVAIVVACVVATFVAGAVSTTNAAYPTSLIRGTVIADIDSRYQRIQVVDAYHKEGEVYLRTVHTDPFGTQCGGYIQNDTVLEGLPLAYTRTFDTLFSYVPLPERILVIGGCNYSYPMHLEKRTVNTVIDVVEIDPAMTKIGKDFFGLTPTERLVSIHQDGRFYLNTIQAKEVRYDVIVVDAFSSPLMSPFQLMSREAFALMRDSLTDEGVVVLNIIGSVNGPGSEYTASVVKTLTATFSSVEMFQISTAPKNTIQNIIVVASMNPTATSTSVRNVPPHRDLLYPIAPSEFPTDLAITFTDDFAPVERLTKPMRDFILEQYFGAR